MTGKKGKTMLKRTKIWIAVFAMMFAMLIPSALAHAAELSGETIEVPEDGKDHTVAAFGTSIAMVYPNGKMEIIANNPSGRIDVMLDGEVIKGIGLITIHAQNKTNMVLEAGSYFVSNISEQQSDSLKRAVADGLAKDMPVSSPSAIENQNGMQGVNAFVVGQRGELQASDGTAVSAEALSGIQVRTPETAYQEFAEEMEESTRKDQEALQEARNRESFSSDVLEEEDTGNENTEEKDIVGDGNTGEGNTGDENGGEGNIGGENTGDGGSNGVTGGCRHNWEPEENVKILTLDRGGSCVTPPFYRCTICKTLMWFSQNRHEHNEGPCEYCGRGGCTVSEDGKHDYVEKTFGTDSLRPLLKSDHSSCTTGTIRACTKCNMLNASDLSKADEHIHGDDFCEYCGYNKNGERKPLGQE